MAKCLREAVQAAAKEDAKQPSPQHSPMAPVDEGLQIAAIALAAEDSRHDCALESTVVSKACASTGLTGLEVGLTGGQGKVGSHLPSTPAKKRQLGTSTSDPPEPQPRGTKPAESIPQPPKSTGK